jgi:crotonobetainyl-CoA:carnitine CoA-transferase CaiB-like acyl-CoA transferase
VLGHPEWIDDPRFASSAQRVVHREAMCAALTDVFLTQPIAHWLQVLREADILCSKVSDYNDVLAHPQIASNGMLVDLHHSQHGAVRVPGFPINSLEAAQTPYAPAPEKGEHSCTVLREFAFSEEEIEALLASDALRCSEVKMR